jgi:hypothetical protein
MGIQRTSEHRLEESAQLRTSKPSQNYSSPIAWDGTRIANFHNQFTVNRSTNISNEPNASAATEGRSCLGKLKHLRRRAGIMLAETMVAAAVLGIVVVGTSHALLTANRIAAASRVLTGARAVLQRNIDTALASTFTQATEPAILAITPATGVPYDDDGGFDNTIQIAVQDNGTAIVASGTLTRTVVAIANADNADIRQITFQLQYNYRGRPVSIAMSTIRSRDD